MEGNSERWRERAREGGKRGRKQRESKREQNKRTIVQYRYTKDLKKPLIKHFNNKTVQPTSKKL